MPKLTLLVGPPGSGKSTLARKMALEGFVRISQDEQGKGHLHEFDMAVLDQKDIVVDRMGFNRQQRSRYLDIAKSKGYETEIIVLHESWKTCFDRVMKRENHETIKDEKNARGALQTFFGKYERPDPVEADRVEFRYPEGLKPTVLVVDLDGTLCNVEHRRHHVRPPSEIEVLGKFDPVDPFELPKPFKKDWAAFFREIPNDTINVWCKDIIEAFKARDIGTVFCSGRNSNERKVTQEWLNKHGLSEFELYMRDRHDSRQDSIVKEIILDFELLTRYTPYFMIDDRRQVVEMWRRRGFVCLQCDEGNF